MRSQGALVLVLAACGRVVGGQALQHPVESEWTRSPTGPLAVRVRAELRLTGGDRTGLSSYHSGTCVGLVVRTATHPDGALAQIVPASCDADHQPDDRALTAHAADRLARYAVRWSSDGLVVAVGIAGQAWSVARVNPPRYAALFDEPLSQLADGGADADPDFDAAMRGVYKDDSAVDTTYGLSAAEAAALACPGVARAVAVNVPWVRAEAPKVRELGVVVIAVTGPPDAAATEACVGVALTWASPPRVRVVASLPASPTLAERYQLMLDALPPLLR